MTNQKRLTRLRKRLAKNKIESLLVTNILNVRYLSGFTGSSASILITQDKALFIADFRYLSQAEEEVTGFKIIKQEKPLGQTLAKILKGISLKELGVEENHLSYKEFKLLCGKLKSVKLIPASGLAEGLRLKKDRREIARIKKAASIAVSAGWQVISNLCQGIREKDIAAELEYQLKKRGARKASFEIIVASGPRSALPHAQAKDRRLKEGDLVLIDWGANFDGYNCDMTRTVAIGRIDKELERVYGTVLRSQKKALSLLGSGVKNSTIDKKARAVIKRAGFGKYFDHSLGHGVGLAVHEGPTISRFKRHETELKAGMVITIEPGIYLPFCGGVRIEDTVLMLKNGYLNLTEGFPKELLIL
ncbi:Xaa-Pro peptidase family protein [bacterium]|nr:Xaa-Pro peptidase family protein [bacterium]